MFLFFYFFVSSKWFYFKQKDAFVFVFFYSSFLLLHPPSRLVLWVFLPFTDHETTLCNKARDVKQGTVLNLTNFFHVWFLPPSAWHSLSLRKKQQKQCYFETKVILDFSEIFHRHKFPKRGRKCHEVYVLLKLADILSSVK